MYPRLLSFDPLAVAAWRGQLARLSTRLGLRLQLVRQQATLVPHFTRYYRQLRAFPRTLRRQLQRQWGQSLAGIALLLTLGAAPSLAATLAVTTNTPAINPDGQCALIEAIVNANADAQTHPDCPAGSGADTITLPANSVQTLTASDNSTLGRRGYR